MTSWNISFDYAAVLGYLLIFIWMVNGSLIPMHSYRIFRLFVADALLATLFEIAATLLARNMDICGFDLFYGVLTLQTFFINMIPIIFAYYLVLLASMRVRNRVQKLLLAVAALIDTIILALNPFLHWAFTFENERYMIAPVGLILYFIDLLMLIACMFVLIRYQKIYRFIKAVPLAFTFIFALVACMLQIFMYIPVLNLLIMTVSLTLYHYQHHSGLVVDNATGAYNRELMGEYIQNLFFGKKRFGLILVAMDDFKFINKTYGVESGDFLLRAVASSLKVIDKSSLVFRFSSDQFCVVLPKNPDRLQNVAEIILNRFHTPWECGTQSEIMLSASICYLECPKDAENYNALIEVLDYSLAETKRLRKGQACRISEESVKKVREEKEIENAVRRVLEKNALMVYYQPIYSTEKKCFHSAEALVRLKDEEMGWISPEIFVPIAERAGLLLEMGETILSKVCRFISKNHLSETGFEFVEVNLSPVQLVQVQFAEHAIQIIESYGVHPSQLNFEITETFAINSLPSVMNNINRLLDYGIRFSLDDYGSGYANINYINQMPFSIVKIDKAILWEAFKNEKAAITLEHTINMLNALDLEIVAEGVETEEMRDKLTSFGCQYLQGWYFSKALPAKEFLQFISA